MFSVSNFIYVSSLLFNRHFEALLEESLVCLAFWNHFKLCELLLIFMYGNYYEIDGIKAKMRITLNWFAPCYYTIFYSLMYTLILTEFQCKLSVCMYIHYTFCMLCAILVGFLTNMKKITLSHLTASPFKQFEWLLIETKWLSSFVNSLK